MIHTLCAICETDTPEHEMYPERLGPDAATPARFSARRVPDRTHYRIVRCRKCGLVRSDPVLPASEVQSLYEDSSLNYSQEIPYARATYGRYLRECLHLVSDRKRLLEVGCGNGFFLEEALTCGFTEVHGVEPSRHAIDLASPEVRNCIHQGTFQDGMFPAGYFDVLCAFQVFDHIAYPNQMLQACRRALRPGGIALFINHDASMWTNRVLGERSPIIDIEHAYLYDRGTMAEIFRKNGFEVVNVFSVENRYPLYYWCTMSPLPAGLKRRLIVHQ